MYWSPGEFFTPKLCQISGAEALHSRESEVLRDAGSSWARPWKPVLGLFVSNPLGRCARRAGLEGHGTE